MLVGVQVVGLLLLKEGLDGLGPMTAREKLPTLRTAQLLLPWDIQVARAESRAQASLGLDNLDEAIRQAHRLLRIAPYRMPTYKWIGTLYKAQGRPDLALATYEQGLRHVPNETTLLYALAAVQEIYARISGRPILLSLATVRLMVKEAGRSHFDHAKSERELALKFRPLEQTVADTVAWYRSHDWF